METNLYEQALKILKARENEYGEKAHNTENYISKMCFLSEASAYNSAWWILYYTIHGDQECLDQFDYFKGE